MTKTPSTSSCTARISTARYESYGAIAIAGWAYDHGKGRVAYTSPGHTLHAMWQPEYVKIQQNAVRWLLKMRE
jgi:type 1 glutamine amidotransferase